MARMSLIPVRGIDNVNEDDALQLRDESGSAGVSVRDAVNVDVTPRGKVLMRGSAGKVSDLRVEHLWHSPINGEVFGVSAGHWGRVNPVTWAFSPLHPWPGRWASHCVLDDKVTVAGDTGIWVWDGAAMTRLTIDTPPAPMVTPTSAGTLKGRVAVGLAWMRKGKESSVSLRVECDADGGVDVILPLPLDDSIDQVRVYATTPGGKEWWLVGTYPASTTSLSITAPPAGPAGAPFRFLDAMPPGRWMRWWKGRLLTAGIKQIHFSEPMAWHLHDRRHGVVLFPQRVTFMAPVEGGVWVGQRDHVLFLRGETPDQWQVQRVAAQPPVPNSLLYLSAEDAGEAAGGVEAALWLSANGYVLGTARGEAIEYGAQRLSGVPTTHGVSVQWGERVLTLTA